MPIEELDLNKIIQSYPPKVEVFKTQNGREFFKRVSRDENGMIRYIVPCLTLYPLPKKEGNENG